MRPGALFAAAALALTIGACSATSYQPLSTTGGFSESRLAEDRFKVVFVGNAYLETGQLETYVLYRCTELTLEHGYDRFVLIESQIIQHAERQYLWFSVDDETTTHAFGSLESDTRGDIAYELISITITKYYAAATMRMLRPGDRLDDAVELYDALALKERLEPRIER